MLELIGTAIKEAAPVAEHLNLVLLFKAGEGLVKVARSCVGLAEATQAL
jgi:hypothetical protein